MGNGEGNYGGGWAAVDFSALPEGCIAHILSFTTPHDVCRSALVSSAFRAAAEADGVWDRFLPPEYRREISDAVSHIFPSFASKKELFLHLCRYPILIHGGAKSFSLDKRTGKKCFMISPRQLSIVWGDAPRYWRWTSPPEARFGEVAELVSVCWLEVRGKIETGMLSRGTLYTAYLVFKPTTSNYGFQHQPVEVGVGLVGTETPKQDVYLDVVERDQWRRRHQIMSRGFGLFNLSRRRIIGTQEPAMSREVTTRNDADAATAEGYRRRVAEERGDGWLEVQLGEFFHDGAEGELEMSVSEVKGGHWKGGLLIQGVEIRPKALKT
ncbi:putative F-box protein PP2-B12 isoform X2 [Momordica charantia]|uniref:F-box protein PP2-B12 isoform X2 n=1 Tax=Momordica charantia TaxID=3673 RepID=A0A6J1CRK5_MOMCH|nr:putative F-box protein PP2-B12 isoform X2 [Momordica charantia]